MNEFFRKNRALEEIKNRFQDKRILILGFGREGISSYRFFRELFPGKQIGIADQNEVSVKNIPEIDKNLVDFYSGESFLDQANSYDVILKSPGISIKSIENKLDISKLDSQANLFLQYFGKQTIGITGTKGKSTTTFLTYETLKNTFHDRVLLAGNMGIPFFDILKSINDDSLIVCEFSSHQLQQVKYSPHISILLNIFQEHLDHYHSYEEYIDSKFNIANFQQQDDYFIYCQDHQLVSERVSQNPFRSQTFSYSVQNPVSNGCFLENNAIIFETPAGKEEIHNLRQPLLLKGLHNLGNALAVTVVAKILGIENTKISESLTSFRGLPHRLEYVGTIDGISFYNDSISTISEAAMVAINSLEHVSTLILGGFDRGIDYAGLAAFLHKSKLKNIAFTGSAGERIKAEMEKIGTIKQVFIVENDYQKIIDWCFQVTSQNETCLLSPAAASFDQFKNFEERGDFFRKMVLAHQ